MNFTLDHTTVRLANPQGFEQALRENPLDEVTHGVYADFLEENRHPEAEAYRKSIPALSKPAPLGDRNRSLTNPPVIARELEHFVDQLRRAASFCAAQATHLFNIPVYPILRYYAASRVRGGPIFHTVGVDFSLYSSRSPIFRGAFWDIEIGEDGFEIHGHYDREEKKYVSNASPNDVLHFVMDFYKEEYFQDNLKAQAKKLGLLKE